MCKGHSYSPLPNSQSRRLELRAEGLQDVGVEDEKKSSEAREEVSEDIESLELD